jgi:hypothetical protein
VITKICTKLRIRILLFSYKTAKNIIDIFFLSDFSKLFSVYSTCTLYSTALSKWCYICHNEKNELFVQVRSRRSMTCTKKHWRPFIPETVSTRQGVKGNGGGGREELVWFYAGWQQGGHIKQGDSNPPLAVMGGKSMLNMAGEPWEAGGEGGGWWRCKKPRNQGDDIKRTIRLIKAKQNKI